MIPSSINLLSNIKFIRKKDQKLVSIFFFGEVHENWIVERVLFNKYD